MDYPSSGGEGRTLTSPADIIIPTRSAPRAEVSHNPLRKYNLVGSLDELRKQMQEQSPLLGDICARGQAGVWYAKPNSGKTLITVSLLREAIINENIVGRDVYYVAADDTASGVVEKLELLQAYEVNVLAPGYKGFQAKDLPAILRSIIADDQAAGSFVILDTLKKFVPLMDKRESSAFADIVRQYVMKGGSLLGLAHTNKRLGNDGKPIFAGTSDILDDFDSGYTIVEVPQQSSRLERIVQFDCIKSRGNVAQQATYCYSIANGLSYAELVDSVRVIDTETASQLRQEADQMADADVIEAIIDCLTEGIDSKMDVARTISRRGKIGRQAVCRIIDKYTGDDPGSHRWTFVRGAHGKQTYSILGEVDLPKCAPGEEF